MACGIALGLNDHLLPRHAGWAAAGILLFAGLALGFWALALPFLVCVPWGVLAHATSNCTYECGAWIILAFFVPFLLWVPVLAGAALRTGLLAARRRRG